MSFLSSLLASAWPYLVAGGAILLGVWRILAGAKKAGRDEQKAKDAEARDENLQKIGDAIDASNHLDPDVMSDPNNRLRRPK